MTNSAGRGRLENPDVLIGILDNLPTSIFVKDENLNFVYSNGVHCEMVGKSESDLLGHSDSDFYPAEEAVNFIRNDRQVLSTGKVVETEEVATGVDGRKTTVLTRKATMQGADGKTYLIGTNSDLGEIKKRELQYKALSGTVPVAVAQIEADGAVTSCNPLFQSLVGDGNEVACKSVLASLSQANAAFPGGACKFEATIASANGRNVNVLAISSGWFELEHGKCTATISLIDITEMSELRRVNAEVSRLNAELAAKVQQLAEAQAEVVKKGRMEQLGQLTATIAHELRNPLGSVRTSAFLMERKTRDKGLGIESQLDRINKGIVRCDNIITQLLDFSRTKELNCEKGNLDSWLETTLQEESRRLPSHILIDVDLGLGDELVPFDPSRLRRALVNMVSNAAEAMVGHETADSAKTSTITISTFAKNGHVSLRVADTGPGMTPDVLARIREPLYTTKSFGTGLGVPAIEQIAVLHGGRLDVRSAPGEGSVFTVWLPLKREPLEQDVSKAA